MRVFTLLATFAVATTAAAQQPTLSIRNNVEGSELIFEIGPLHLEANSDHSGVTQPKTQRVALPITGYLHGYSFEMIDAAGVAIPSALLHHVNIIVPQRRELFSHIMQRLGAAGSETGAVNIPKLIGYPVSVGDSLVFTAMFHNPTDESYHDARLRVRMRYTGEKAWHPRWAVQPFYLDVMPPAGFHAYDLPPGRSSKSWEGQPAVAGRVLMVGAHLHKYGVALRLEDVTENKVLWETSPEFDSAGNVVRIPRKSFVLRGGLELRPDRVYRLTAIYDNPTGEVLPGGGMGALGGLFMPAEKAWPEVDRTHPDYLVDLKVTYEGSHHDGDGSHSGH